MLTADTWEDMRFRLIPHAYHSARSSMEDAEDAVQDAFVGYFEQVKRGRLIRRPFVYIWQSVKNRSLSRARRTLYTLPLDEVENDDRYPVRLSDPPADDIEQAGEAIDRTILLASVRHHAQGRWLFSYYRQRKPSGQARTRAHRLVGRLRRELDPCLALSG